MTLSNTTLAVLLLTPALAWAQPASNEAPAAPPGAAPAAPTAAPASTAPVPTAPGSTAPAAKPHHRWHRRHHAAPAAPGAAQGGSIGASAPKPVAAPRPHAAPAAQATPAAPSQNPVAAPPPVAPAPAAPPAAHAALGSDLTPFGAIVAGNNDGTIPAWTGGLTKPPAGFVAGGPHPNPYAGEQKLFSITAANMGQYAAHLTPGIQAMLRTYPAYRVDVYPSHRSFAAPAAILNAAIANASRASLGPSGNSVIGARQSIPFPVPQSGLQAVWNHLLRFRGYQAHFTAFAASPTASGDYTLLKNETKLLFGYATGTSSESGVLSYYMIKTLAPPLFAGTVVLAQDHVDPATHPRDAWIYSPGEERVRRAPEVNFDTPIAQADSLVTDDDLDLFNGSPERFNWNLVGRREIYVPYNDYEFGSETHDYADLLKPGFINPDLMRWELHRVWVVEATLKPGAHHLYPRRTFYYDEDSWEGLLADEYDRRGQIWRVASGAPIEYYEVPLLTNSANIFYDLQARRYHVRGMRNRDTFLNFFTPKMQPSDFSTAALRDTGVR